LQAASFETKSFPSGAFNTQSTNVAKAYQMIVKTEPYSTEAKGGLFCVPTNTTLKDSLQDTAMEGYRRVTIALGSLDRVWWQYLVGTLVAVIAAFILGFLLQLVGTAMVAGLFLVVSLVFLAFAVFLFFSIGAYFDEGNFVDYRTWNVLFTYFSSLWATIISCVLGLIFLFIGLDWLWFKTILVLSPGIGAKAPSCLKPGKTAYLHQKELFIASRECLSSMPFLAIQPFVHALVQFVIAYFLCWGFLLLLSTGTVWEYGISINGSNYLGLSKDFNFWYPDFSGLSWRWEWFPVYFENGNPSGGQLVGLLWICFYILVSWYIMEVTVSFNQFIVAYCSASWYLSAKDGFLKVPPKKYMLIAYRDAWLYHIGSIAAAPFKMLGPRTSRVLTSVLGTNRPEFKEDAVLLADVAIRSVDLRWSSARSGIYRKPVKDFIGCHTLGFMICVGVAAFTGLAVVIFWLSFEGYEDPTEDYYVADLWVTGIVGFILFGYVAYSVVAVFELTGDVLLYCYGFNKKYNKKTVDLYCPETLRHVVGWDDKITNKYEFYGKASRGQYLNTFLPKKPQKHVGAPITGGSTMLSYAGDTSK
jgi:hypothetical protein